MVLQSGFSFQISPKEYILEDGYLVDITSRDLLIKRVNHMLKVSEEMKSLNYSRGQDPSALSKLAVELYSGRPKEPEPKTIIRGSDRKYFMNLMKVDAESNESILAYYNTFGGLAASHITIDNNEIDQLAELPGEPLEVARRAIQYFQHTFNLCISINKLDLRAALGEVARIYSIIKDSQKPIFYKLVESAVADLVDFVDFQPQELAVYLLEVLTACFQEFDKLPFIDYFDEAIKRGFPNVGEFTFDVKGLDHPDASEIIAHERKVILGEISVERSILFSIIRFLAEHIINAHIEYVSPRLVLSGIKTRGEWHTYYPLSAIYFEYYLALCEKAIFKKCEYKNCPRDRYFEINGADHRKQYCSPQCANSACIQNKRVRDKAAKEAERIKNEQERTKKKAGEVNGQH